MIRFFVSAFALLLVMLAWNASVFVAMSEGWFKSPIAESRASGEFAKAAAKRVGDERVGNFSMILIEGGEIAERYALSVGVPVDGSTVFQVASLGKWLTAWGVMTLVEDGDIDLDAPVSAYLTRWRLPDSEYDSSGVTVRRLLSHTAGLADGLGYDGFARVQDVQTLEQSLTRALDASPGSSGVVSLGAEPGSEWNYSGGGYTLLQLLVEEVSGQAFSEFMAGRVFDPLGMTRTTFDHETALGFGLAENYALDGATEPFRWYTALAATSLFTTAEDLAMFITAQTAEGGQSVLSNASLAVMKTPHASQMGVEIWGAGPMLFAPNNNGGHIIGHDGNNEPAINTAARFDPATGDGIVILSTGSDLLATRLAGEWIFWKTGNIDNLMFAMSFGAMLLWMGAGSVVILILGVFLGLRSRKPGRVLAAS